MLVKSRQRLSIALIALLLFIVVVSLLFPPSQWIPAKVWGAQLESAGFKGMILFVLAGMLATSIGLPRQMVAFIGGLAYGVMPGVLLSFMAALLGCYLTLQVSRRFLATWVAQRYPNVVTQLDKLLRNDAFVKILILRLQPLGTNLLTNVCMGFTAVSHRVFIAASSVGYVPQMLVFALLGAGVRVGSQTQLLLSAILMLISVMLGVALYYRHRQRRLT